MLTLAEAPALQDEWSELAERSGNLFATWEWQSLWWKHYGGGRERLVATERDAGGKLRVVVPLYVWRARPLRILRFAGHGAGDELGPIHAPEDRSLAAEALARCLARAWHHVFVGEQLPGPESWAGGLPGARVLSRTGSPSLELAGRSWDELLREKSRNFRDQVGRRERKLARAHELSFRLVHGPDELDPALDTLFDLHALHRGSATTFARTEPFQREFARVAAERGWLRLWILDLGGRPAAVWLGFRYGGAECYYQAGRDPALDELSVGFVLLSHTIRAALEDGAERYRFLRGGESYKYRFADSDPGLETIAVARGPVARAALAAARAWRQIGR